MAHKVFISYAKEDKSIADSVCTALEDSGVQCWIAPRDVPYGVDYEEGIVDAISTSKLMLLVLSSHSNDSRHVKREVQNACREEPQVPILPFQVEDIPLNKSLKYYIGSVHWLSALTPPLVNHLRELADYVKRLPQLVNEEVVQASQPQEITERRADAELPAEEGRISGKISEAKHGRAAAEVVQSRNEGESTRPAFSAVTTPGSSPLSRSVNWLRKVTQTEEPLWNARRLYESQATTDTVEPAQLPDGKGKRMTLFVYLACLVVAAALVLVWTGVMPGTWRGHRILFQVCIGVLVLTVVAFVTSTSTPPTAKRLRLVVMVSGGVVLAALGLIWGRVLPLPSVGQQIVLVACIVVFIVALFAFVARTSLTRTAMQKSALVMACPVSLMVVALASMPKPTSTQSDETTSPVVRNQPGIELVYVPAGRFWMGSENGEPDEKPVHQVTVSRGFYMGKYEVTQAQWQSVMGTNPSYFKACDQCPVEQVSWYEAQEFIIRLNVRRDGYAYRLPTEAEWEYACRAGTTTAFAYGDSLSSEQANFDGRSPYGKGPLGVYREQTTQVGSFQPNAFGLYDMHGNVLEWCQDWYRENYDGAPADSNTPYTGGGQKYEVFRGGSYGNDAKYLRSSKRGADKPDLRMRTLGLRVAADVQAQ